MASIPIPPKNNKNNNSNSSNSNSHSNSNSNSNGNSNSRQGAGPKSSKKEKLPHLMGRLEQCETNGQHSLDLSDLHLSAFPREAVLVPNIRELKVFNNTIIEFPILKEFKYIDYLDFSRTQLQTIPLDTLSLLINLKHLNLCRNNLESLPEDLSSLRLLEELIIHRNKLKTLPEAVGGLRYLRVLDASYNELTYIGSLFEESLKLDVLNLSNNPDLQIDDLGARTRRLHDKRQVMGSRVERQALVKRALGVQRGVLTREQQIIFRDMHESRKKGQFSSYLFTYVSILSIYLFIYL